MEINSIALNTEFDKAICSSLYEIFYVSRPDLVLPQYLNLFIKRDEFARQCEFIGWVLHENIVALAIFRISI